MKWYFFCFIGFMTFSALAMYQHPDDRHPNGLAIPGSNKKDTSPVLTPVRTSSLSTEKIDLHELKSLYALQIAHSIPSRVLTCIEDHGDFSDPRMEINLRGDENETKESIKKLDENYKDKTDATYKLTKLGYAQQLTNIRVALALCEELRVKLGCDLP